jgi:hypothetical protein
VAFQTPVTIAKALERIDRHEYLLPAIQREFVWKTEQIGRLFDSVMQGYPIGSFLFWSVDSKHVFDFVLYEFMTDYHERKSRHLRRHNLTESRSVTAVLDGQQRLTSLNIGLRGSHAEKLPRKWADNLSAYPVRYLYLNLSSPAEDNELGMEFDFRFLTKERALELSKSEMHWFPVPQILRMESGADLFDYVQDAGVEDVRFAFRTLSLLHEVVNQKPIINYFEEESQDLEKVLNVFIRANSGGSPLTYSDLLLSIATAQWKDVEARDAIHSLVDELNETGQGFAFTKDIVLKAGLVLTDTPSIAFRVTNFNASNMAKLESNWHSIAQALRLAVRLLADFGFSDRTLTADSVVIPIAYYLHRRMAQEQYLTSHSAQTDRELVRLWVVRSLLKPGVWGSGLDTLLLNLRSVIREEGYENFPAVELEPVMTRLGKSLRFEEDEVQDLLSLSSRDRRVFPLLSLLYPGMDFRNEFHVDHVFPRSRFARKYLLAEGVSPADVDELAELADRLPNLQLLEGPYNVSKQDKPPAEWIRNHFPDIAARDAYAARHDLGNVPELTTGFRTFYDERQYRMGHRLRTLLGITRS